MPESFRRGVYAVIDGVAHEAHYVAGQPTVCLISFERDNPEPEL